MNLETFSISYCDDIEVEAAMQSLFSLAKTILENSQLTLTYLELSPFKLKKYDDLVHEFMKEVISYDYANLKTLDLANSQFCSIEQLKEVGELLLE